MNAVIILAAGESKRLGQPKQLLRHEGETLVRRAVTSARLAGADEVVVVTGAYHEAVKEELAVESCHIAHNSEWRLGMGQSIACGARFVSALSPSADFVLLQLCDQPFIPASHLRQLLSAATATSVIAATQYPDHSSGIPACFPAKYLPALAMLSGHLGAKSLIAAEECVVLPCSHADIDIDVVADLEKLNGG